MLLEVLVAVAEVLAKAHFCLLDYAKTSKRKEDSAGRVLAYSKFALKVTISFVEGNLRCSRFMTTSTILS